MKEARTLLSPNGAKKEGVNHRAGIYAWRKFLPLFHPEGCIDPFLSRTQMLVSSWVIAVAHHFHRAFECKRKLQSKIFQMLCVELGGKQQGVIDCQHFLCTPPSFRMSSCADLVLLLCRRNFNREYALLGRIRGEFGSQSCC